MDGHKLAPNQAEPRLLGCTDSIKTLNEKEHCPGRNGVQTRHKVVSSERNETQWRKDLHDTQLLGIFSISHQWGRAKPRESGALELVVLAPILKQSNEAQKDHPPWILPASRNLLECLSSCPDFLRDRYSHLVSVICLIPFIMNFLVGHGVCGSNRTPRQTPSLQKTLLERKRNGMSAK